MKCAGVTSSKVSGRKGEYSSRDLLLLCAPESHGTARVGMFGEQCSAVWPGYGLAGWLVGEYYHARTEGSGLDQLQHLLLAPFSKETLSAAQHYRKDHQPIFID